MANNCPIIYNDYKNKFILVIVEILSKKINSYIEIAKFINNRYFQEDYIIIE